MQIQEKISSNKSSRDSIDRNIKQNSIDKSKIKIQRDQLELDNPEDLKIKDLEKEMSSYDANYINYRASQVLLEKENKDLKKILETKY